MNFPKEAEAVRKYIRDNVGRPKELPIFNELKDALRWGTKCPMGLCPGAKNDAPLSSFATGIPEKQRQLITQKAIIYFIKFWDTTTDPQYAVDTVWGKA